MMELIHVCVCDYYGLAVPMMNVSQQPLVDNRKLSRHIWTYRRRRHTVIRLVLVWAAIDSTKMMTEQFAMTMTANKKKRDLFKKNVFLQIIELFRNIFCQ